MHPNAAFRWENRDGQRAFARDVGFGMIFAGTPDGPRVAHAPFVFFNDDRIRFHLARGNALSRHLDGLEALLVVNGPDGYISPDWYGIDDQVPTWNYLALEMQGMVRKLDRDELAEQVASLSSEQEERLAPKPAWTHGKMSNGLFDKMLGAITGFELSVTAWRSTAKLGQNKDEVARQNAAAGAEAAGRPAIAHLMRLLPQ